MISGNKQPNNIAKLEERKAFVGIAIIECVATGSSCTGPFHGVRETMDLFFPQLKSTWNRSQRERQFFLKGVLNCSILRVMATSCSLLDFHYLLHLRLVPWGRLSANSGGSIQYQKIVN